MKIAIAELLNRTAVVSYARAEGPAEIVGLYASAEAAAAHADNLTQHGYARDRIRCRWVERTELAAQLWAQYNRLRANPDTERWDEISALYELLNSF